MMSELLECSTLEASALTVAGSDSGAGAGIQADLKTFAAHGVYGVSVVTMVTAQNTQGVNAIEMVPGHIVRSQLEAVFSDFRICAVKTGALGNTETVQLVSRFFRENQVQQLVVDPVMISKHGHPLIAESAIGIIREQLLPLAAVVTPNIPEAVVLSGMNSIDGMEEMQEAARRIGDFGCGTVVLKGGHSAGDAADLVWDGQTAHWLATERISTPHTHGTGCTFSAAIAAGLARGLPVLKAVSAAKEYITGAIANVRLVGRGINPVNHFWRGRAK